jgi:hypothetical protein
MKNLQWLLSHPQGGQLQGRVHPGDEHQPDMSGQPLQHEIQTGVNIRPRG